MSRNHIISIALFGSVWGFVEATLGGLLHLTDVPFTGTILASFGFTILYAAMRAGIKPSQIFCISLVAAAFKFADVWLFNLPLFYIKVINPAVAIASQGLAFSLVFKFSRGGDTFMQLLPRFLIAAGATMIAFNAISLGAFGWETNHTAKPLVALFVQLPIMAIATTILAKTYAEISPRLRWTLSPAWQTTAATLLAAMAIAARVNLVG